MTEAITDRAEDVLVRVDGLAGELEAGAEETERLGKLSPPNAAAVRAAGTMRLLQAPEHGGYAADPRIFAEAVMATARRCGSTGWVCGVVGVHPWELALMDPRLSEEIWADDPDVWVSSPYTPNGVAEPVDGGYMLTGRWPFSSGTDHADWVMLGALTGDGSGIPAKNAEYLHVTLPRADYEILEDSWNVVGLKGTGSKDVVVQGAFIPAYRTISHEDVVFGAAAEKRGRTDPLYKLPFSVIFPVGITAAIIGISEGALAAHLAYQRTRVSPSGASKARDDHEILYVIAEAASEIEASRLQLLAGVGNMYEAIGEGAAPTPEDVFTVRRNQIRCAWRCVAAVDEIFGRSGGNAGRESNPLQRFWRDAHMGLQHFIHIPGPIYKVNALRMMDLELTPEEQATI